MKNWLTAVPAVICIAFAPLAGAAESRSILIEVDGEAKFDVIYHRASVNSAGAVIGGLIGAGIQASVEADRDTKKRQEIRPHVGEHVWRDVYVKTLNETFLSKGIEPIWVEGGEKPKDFKADLYLLLMPDSYGFRLVDTTTSLLSPYVEFSAAYASQPINRRKKFPKEDFYVTSRKQASYEALVAEAAGLNADVEDVLAQAARRLANKIAYNAK